jgi:signal transduction histidine kinase
VRFSAPSHSSVPDTLFVMEAVTPAADRLRAFVDATVAITAELSLDALLQQLVEAAAALTGARYAALGVIDRSGFELERFLTTGMDADTHAAIGELPRGRGILGVLISEAKPLRLHELGKHERSVGFPSNHPPMRSFLGVPIKLRGVAYGNLYLTEKAGGKDFTEEDQEIVGLLAGQAAVSIENARLFEAATAWSSQLESLNEVGNALGSEVELEPLLDLIVRRLHELLNASFVAVLLPEGADELRFAAVAGEGGKELVGETMPLSSSKSGRVMERGRSERADSMIDDPEVNSDTARVLGARTGLWVPLVVRSKTIGVLEAHDKLGRDARFSDNDLRLAETFAARAALAVDLSGRVARDSLRRVLAAQEAERRRLARELHDETGQALTSIVLGLKSLEEQVEGEPAMAAIAQLRQLVVSTLQSVRQLAVELRPKALDDFGLVPALERLTAAFSDQTGIPVDLQAPESDERLSEEVETALYRSVQESLTNVAKHARAHHVSVLVTRRDRRVSAVVEDDGQGFDPGSPREGGFGLVGMRERLALVGGRVRIESRGNGSGTTIAVEAPVD